MTRGPWNHSSSRTVLRACILSSGAPSTFAQDLFHANFFGLAGLPGSRSSLALFRTGSGSLGVLAVLHPGGNVCHLLVGGSLGTLDDRVRNLGGFLEHLQRLLQVNDVNSIALAEDIFLHLRVPTLRLVPEVNPGFEQLLHRDICQATS